MRPLNHLRSSLRQRTRRLPELRNPNDTKQINMIRNPNYSRQIDSVQNPNHHQQTDLVRDPNNRRQIIYPFGSLNYCQQQSYLVPEPNYSAEELGYEIPSEDEDTDRWLEEQLRGGHRVNPSEEEGEDPNYFARYAVEDYNLKKNQQLEFVEMIKSTRKPSSGQLFRVIFKVKDNKDGKLKIFAGDVWLKLWKEYRWMKSFGLRHVG